MEQKLVILQMLLNLDGELLDVQVVVNQIMVDEDDEVVDEVIADEEAVDDEVMMTMIMCVEMEYCKDQTAMEKMNNVTLDLQPIGEYVIKRHVIGEILQHLASMMEILRFQTTEELALDLRMILLYDME